MTNKFISAKEARTLSKQSNDNIMQNIEEMIAKEIKEAINQGGDGVCIKLSEREFDYLPEKALKELGYSIEIDSDVLIISWEENIKV